MWTEYKLAQFNHYCVNKKTSLVVWNLRRWHQSELLRSHIPSYDICSHSLDSLLNRSMIRVTPGKLNSKIEDIEWASSDEWRHLLMVFNARSTIRELLMTNYEIIDALQHLKRSGDGKIHCAWLSRALLNVAIG